VLVAPLLLLADTAAALSISGNTVSFTNGTLSGTITLVEMVTGAPLGAETLVGSAPDASKTSLVFQVAVMAGALDELGVSLFLKSSTGAGRIPGAEPDALVDVVAVTGTAGARLFQFGAGSENVDPGDTSDAFFVAYNTADVLALVDQANQVAFMVSPVPGADFTVTATITSDPGAIFVPEPGSLGLAGLALGCLLLARRRRDAHRS
jgi:hypothetical protein